MLAARILIALLLTLVAIPPASGAHVAADSAALRLNGHADPEISAPAGVAGGGLVGVGARPPIVGELTAAGVVASLPKTRVWGFRLGLAPCDRGRPELTPSSHWDYRLPYDGIAVGSPLVPRGTTGGGRIPWTSWRNYEKVTVNGQEYAKVGDRLFTQHAVDRMQPSGLRGTTGGSGGMPQIRQAGGGYDYGRGVAPQFVEDAIASSRGVLQPNGNISHTSGSLQVILNPDGAVVTIITH